MPKKGARSLFNKKDSETFVLVHRSMQDPKYYDDNESKHVLLSTKAKLALPVGHGSIIGGSTVLDREGEAMLFDNPEDASIASEYANALKPSKKSTENSFGIAQSVVSGSGRQSVRTTRTRQTYQQGPGSVRSNTSTSSRVSATRRKIGRVTELSEVNEMGLPVDGYNYSQHFTSGGGGVFIDKSGRVSRNGSVATRSIYNGGNNGNNDSDSIFDSSASAMLRLADGRSVVSSASVLDELAEGIYTTHEAANRVGLPLSVLPTVPEQEAETDLGKRLEAVVLRVESMPADLRKVMDLIEEVDIDDDDDDHEEEEEEQTNTGSNVKASYSKFPSGSNSSSANPDTSNQSSNEMKLEKLPGYVPLAAIKDIDVEELQDDFVLRALGELPISDDINDNVQTSIAEDKNVYADDVKNFDFEAHVKALLARAEGQMIDTEDLDENGENDDEVEFEFDEDDEDNGDEEYDDEDNYRDDGPLVPGKQRIGNEILQAMLEQYDEENYGELDDNDPRLRQDGNRSMFSSSNKGSSKMVPNRTNIPITQEGDEDYDDEEEQDDDNDDDDDDEEEDYDDDNDDNTGEKLVPISADSLLKSAIADYDRHKEEGMLLSAYQVAMMGRNDGKEEINDNDDYDDDDDEDDDDDSLQDGNTNDNHSSDKPSEHTISAILAQSEGTSVPSKSAAFKVKIGLLKTKTNTVDNSTSSSSSIAIERPPSPVSSAAAQVAAKLVSTINKFNEYTKITERELHRKQNPNSAQTDEEKIIPFGWAEGDIKDDALDYFPPEWTQFKEQPKWDVDTVISTFTTTEHHPKRLDDGVSISSSRLHQGPRKLGDKSNNGGGSIAPSSVSLPGSNLESIREDGRSGKGNSMVVGNGIAEIRLSKKTGLPMGRTKKVLNATIPEDDNETKHGKEEEDDDETNSTDNDDDNNNDEEDEEQTTTVSLVRQRGETAEEKRLRKAHVKAERREKRAQKKNTKLAYKEEILRQKDHVHKLDSLGRGTIII